jgi:hypothetical protein
MHVQRYILARSRKQCRHVKTTTRSFLLLLV